MVGGKSFRIILFLVLGISFCRVVWGAELTFVSHNITTSLTAPHSVFAIDLDKDGDTDVLSASGDDRITWYENDGNEIFAENIITISADIAHSVFAIDIDSDNDIDVLSANWGDGKIAWYENDGNEGFTTHIITTSTDWPRSVFAIDVDSDNDIDVLSASSRDDKVAWYENDGNENFTTHNITTSADGAYSVFAIDLDRDGDVDVLSTNNDNHGVVWYENDGNENFTTHTISTSIFWPYSVFAIDLDSDNDIDVISAGAAGDKIGWYENDGNENFTTHIITTSMNHPHSVFAIDLDSDNDIDVLSSSVTDDKIAWYENDGNEDFTEYTITTSLDYPKNVFAIDIDSDNDIDVLSSGLLDNEIAWYENMQQTLSCNNGVKDGDETDIDCGGSCPKCSDGKNCLSRYDCVSDFCNEINKCGCIDYDNDGEEDIRCGGDDCNDNDGATIKCPVLLVHGYMVIDPNGTWYMMKDWLKEDGFDVYYIDLEPWILPANGDITDYAGKLDDEIISILENTKAAKIDIIGHSMGGLVSRWYSRFGYRGNIRNIIMLGTPNHGSELFYGKYGLSILSKFLIKFKIIDKIADFILGDAGKQMTPYSLFLNMLNHNNPLKTWGTDILTSGVGHHTMAGIDDFWLTTIFLFGEDDGLVRVKSVKLDNSNSHEEYYLTHSQLTKDSELYSDIKDILETPGLVEGLGIMALPPEEVLSKTQEAFYIDDSIQQDFKIYNFTISYSNISVFLLSWYDEETILGLNLIMPNGTLINETFEDINATYYPANISENDTIEGFVVDSPMEGVWQAKAIFKSGAETNYTFLVLLDTDLRILILTDKPNYGLNEAINLTVNLTSFGNPVLNSSVEASVKKPNGMIENLTLYDNGIGGDKHKDDGSYFNFYNNTDLLGIYEITAIANGTLNGTDYYRQKTIQTEVYKPVDLYLNDSDIYFSNSTPAEEQEIEISALIHNKGDVDLENISIEFYNDDPEHYGKLIGKDLINISANSYENASVLWNAKLDCRYVFVLISPFNSFLEEDYSNNMANRSIDVKAKITVYNLTDYYSLNQGDTWTYLWVEDNYNETEIVLINGTEIINSVNTKKMYFYYEGGYEYAALIMTSEGLKEYKWFEEDEFWDESYYEIYSPPFLRMPAEMNMSQTHNFFANYTGYEDGYEWTGNENFTLTLLNVENVTVPAGTFEALKFSYSGSWEDDDGCYGNDSGVNWLAYGVGIIKDIGNETEYCPGEGTDFINFSMELINATVGNVSYPKEELVKFNITLTKGWNLVSFPLNLTNWTLPEPFKSIEGNYSKIFTYDKKWIELKDDDRLNETKGFWINMTNDDVLEVEGYGFNGLEYDDLGGGWGLLSYDLLNVTLLDINLTEEVWEENETLLVWGYIDENWLSYHSDKPIYLNTLKNLTPGYGYWVRTD